MIRTTRKKTISRKKKKKKKSSSFLRFFFVIIRRTIRGGRCCSMTMKNGNRGGHWWGDSVYRIWYYDIFINTSILYEKRVTSGNKGKRAYINNGNGRWPACISVKWPYVKSLSLDGSFEEKAPVVMCEERARLFFLLQRVKFFTDRRRRPERGVYNKNNSAHYNRSLLGEYSVERN